MARPRSRLDVDAGDAVLACALHRVSPAGRTVVHFHGNGEVVADWQDGFPEVIGRLGWDLLLAGWAGGPVSLRVFETGDHSSILFENQETYFALLGKFLRERAGATPPATPA